MSSPPNSLEGLLKPKEENPVVCDNRDEPEDVVLSEISQSWRDSTGWSHCYEAFGIVKPMKAGDRKVIARGLGSKGKLLINRHKA